MTDSVDKHLALFCDFENIALGVRDARYAKFDINRVLERLLVKGTIIVKKAYCDWGRYKDFKAVMHEANFELIDIPHVRQSGKNSADIRMVVDALDLCYTKSHVNTFVVISGDSDFSPLVSKLRENAKTVIGVGVKNSTSDLLIGTCDEFIYYDDLIRERKQRKSSGAAARRKKPSKTADSTQESGDRMQEGGDRMQEGGDRMQEGGDRMQEGGDRTQESSDRTQESGDRMQEGIDLTLETAEALNAERGDQDKLWGSMVKQALKRRRPSFNETYYGFDSFSRLLEEARDRGQVELELDERSGGYIIRDVIWARS